MGKRVRVAAALVICPFILAACGLGAPPGGLPSPPGDADCLATPKPHGPACRDVKDFQFQEASQDTEVDLERAGGTPDLSYDHFTGEFKPIHGAKVSLYAKDSGWPWGGEPDNRSGYPGEEECHRKRIEGLDAFSKDDLQAKFSIFCIKTAEGHDGFLVITPIPDQKPDAYHVYTHVWVR